MSNQRITDGKIPGFGLIGTIAGGIFAELKRSFLLKFSTFGLVLTVFAGLALPLLNLPIWAGVVGMAGIVMFLWGLVMYYAYLLLARVF